MGARKSLKGHSRFFLPSYYDLGDIWEKRDQKLMIAFEARCSTTAMGIMPHSDVNQALELALSSDIPTPGNLALLISAIT